MIQFLVVQFKVTETRLEVSQNYLKESRKDQRTSFFCLFVCWLVLFLFLFFVFVYSKITLMAVNMTITHS